MGIKNILGVLDQAIIEDKEWWCLDCDEVIEPKVVKLDDYFGFVCNECLGVTIITAKIESCSVCGIDLPEEDLNLTDDNIYLCDQHWEER